MVAFWVEPRESQARATYDDRRNHTTTQWQWWPAIAELKVGGGGGDTCVSSVSLFSPAAG